MVAILLPCLNIRDKRGDVLSALFLESVNGVLNSEQSNRRCWKTASGLPWSHKAHLPGESYLWKLVTWTPHLSVTPFNLSDSPINSFWGQIFTKHKHCAEAKHISISHAPVIWELPLYERPSHNTCYHGDRVFGERGRTGYFQYCTTGLREIRDSIPKKISFSSYKFNSHKDTIYIILICHEIKAFNVFIFKGSLHLQALIQKP